MDVRDNHDTKPPPASSTSEPFFALILVLGRHPRPPRVRMRVRLGRILRLFARVPPSSVLPPKVRLRREGVRAPNLLIDAVEMRLGQLEVRDGVEARYCCGR